MRDSWKSRASWIWPLALLALPACAFQMNGLPNPNAFDPGTAPLTGAVMCDIPKVPLDASNCATPTEVMTGLPKARAAISLADGSHNNLVLDYSADAMATCNGPRKIEFFDPFPDGTTVCLNCGQQIPKPYADPTAVCVAKCKELVSVSGSMPPEGVDKYCETNAHISTNFGGYMCFDKACTAGGMPDPTFKDPRRAPEFVKWVDTTGASPTGTNLNGLQRMAPTSGPNNVDFNAGGASVQLIEGADAWVEFSAKNIMLSQVLGVRESCDDISACPDMEPTLNDIGYSIILNNDQHVYVIESNPTVTVHGPYGTYAPDERYRIHITDNNDKTATITYTRVMGTCTAGTPCTEMPLYQHVGPGPKYPLRINATFREYLATVDNVTLMRIQ